MMLNKRLGQSFLKQLFPIEANKKGMKIDKRLFKN